MQKEQGTMRNVSNLDIITCVILVKKLKGYLKAQSGEESGGLETSSTFLYLLY